MKKNSIIIYFLLLLILFCAAGARAQTKTDEPFKIIEPQGVIYICPGDFLQIKFQAPENGVCKFSISPFDNLPMTESSPGMYEGVFYLPYHLRYPSTAGLSINYRGADGKNISVKYPETITYMNDPVPIVVKSKSDEYQLRSGPSTDYDRTAYLAKDVKFAVNKRVGDWLRLNTLPINLWVNKDFVEILNPGNAASYGILNSVRTEDNPKSAGIIFSMSGPCAYSLNNYKNEIHITFHNAASALFETRYGLRDNIIDEINITESGPGYVKIKIGLNIKNSWGYEAGFEENKFMLKIRKPPLNTSSLKDKVIVLDAGHGGGDPGAVGPGNTAEKDVNLAIILKLKRLLESGGAKVVLTRPGDSEVLKNNPESSSELQARCDINKSNGGTIAISVHNNSHSDEEKRKTLTNTDIYFYRPQSKPLADSIAKNLGKTLGKENYFSLQRSFYLTRQTYAPSVLIEVTFISNPQEEQKLKDPTYQQKAAEGIYNGIVEYFGGN